MSEESPDIWFGERVERGSRSSLSLVLSESYSGTDIAVPVQVWRGEADGPTVCVTAAVHGDEINGTGAIRHIIREAPFQLIAGTLILLPVVNLLGFERHTRYLPDRRDLNRSFPGSSQGSLTSRIASSFFKQVIRRCDYCIDLHTAAVRRTNFPNVRANLKDARLADFARAFGAELTIQSVGPKGSLRAEACKAGCATLILEAGEVWKVQASVVQYTLRGITNCLRFLKMIEGEPRTPLYRAECQDTGWVRAKRGGFLEFHVAPGDVVAKDDPVATNTDLVGAEQNVIRAPDDGVVLGMTTLPSVGPGDPVCNIAYPSGAVMDAVRAAIKGGKASSLHARVREDLARSVMIVQP